MKNFALALPAVALLVALAPASPYAGTFTWNADGSSWDVTISDGRIDTCSKAMSKMQSGWRPSFRIRSTRS